MDSGSFFFGAGPDDGDGPDDEDSLGGADGLHDDAFQDEDVVQRGWIEPDDRLWRHPSEMSYPAGASQFARHDRLDLWRDRRPAVAAGTAGAAAVAAAAILVLVLTNAPSVHAHTTSSLRATDASLVTVPSMTPSVVSAVKALRASLVEVRTNDDDSAGDGATPVTGVVMPGGKLILTSADSVAGRSSLNIVTSEGRQMAAKVVGSDPASGVGVLSVSSALDPATFANEPVYPGELAVTACLRPDNSAGAAPTTAMAVGAVKDVGGDSPAGAQEPMDAIEAEMPAHVSWGGVLVDGAGAVIGIPESHPGGGESSGSSSSSSLFVPSSLALGVAQELASNHQVVPGWIGVVASDAAHDTGASIQQVMTGSPASAAGLQPGDVVVGVDGEPVLSLADLQAHLYTVEPGRQVQLVVKRSGALDTMSVTVGDLAGG